MQKVAILHVHTVASEKDATGEVKDYALKIENINKKSNRYEIVGCAVTEHGHARSMCTARVELEKKKITHILGSEIYLCSNEEAKDRNKRFHFVIMCRNGYYKNFVRVLTHAGHNKHTTSFKKYFITNKEEIRKYKEGFIGTTACLGGELSRLLLEDKIEEAKECIEELSGLVHKLYLEIQPHEFYEQIKVNKLLCQLSEEMDIPLVIGQDVHYTEPSEHEIYKAFNIMANMNNKGKDEEEENSNHEGVTYHLKSFEEIEEYIAKYDIPYSAITNTYEIWKETNSVDFRPKHPLEFMPKFPVPNGYSDHEYLVKIATDGLRDRIIQNNFTDIEDRFKRLNHELKVIEKTGFSGYFLVLWDWCNAMKKRKIVTGPGRGSAASSLVNYALRITKVDPMNNHLLFSRFLNEERLDLPDIDLDVITRHRKASIKYFKEKYGENNVSQIITDNQYKIKMILQNAIKLSGGDAKEAQAISKSFEDITYDKLYNYYYHPETQEDVGAGKLKKYQKNFEEISKILEDRPDIAPLIIKGNKLVSGSGIHAAGVIISGVAMNDYFPTEDGGDSAVLSVLSVDMNSVGVLNLLKVDILGLNTLQIMDDARNMAELPYEWLESEDFSDQNVYEHLYSKLGTKDIFQLAALLPTRFIKSCKINSLSGISDTSAIIRPGGIAKIEQLNNKSMMEIYEEMVHKNSTFSIGLEEVDSLLSTTRGTALYQEQLQKIGQIVASYTLGGADIRIRKTIGKFFA